MPAGGPTASSQKTRRQATSKDSSPARGILSFIRLFRRRRSLSSERRVATVSSPPPQRPVRASSEDRQMGSYRPRKRAAPAPPVAQPWRPNRCFVNTQNHRRSMTVTSSTDHVRHVRGKRKAPPPPQVGYGSLQTQRVSPPPATEPAAVRSLDRAVNKHPSDQKNRQTDTLVLEDGVLRPRSKQTASTGSISVSEASTNSRSVGTLSRLAAAAGPRLWYKRKKDDPKPAELKDRRGRRDRRGKHQGAGDGEGELDWLADMVYARQSVAPPDGTVQRRLQILRHLTDQEERSGPASHSQQSQQQKSSQAEGVASPSLSGTEPAKHQLKSPGLVRQVYPQLPSQSGDSPASGPQPPVLPDKHRSPLRNLFTRDRSPRDKQRLQAEASASSAAKPRFSLLSNISALDAEAAKLIEGRATTSAGSGGYDIDPAATLPSSSQLSLAEGSNGHAKSHAQQEKEKRETCQTIAMLVKEKFEENCGEGTCEEERGCESDQAVQKSNNEESDPHGKLHAQGGRVETCNDPSKYRCAAANKKGLDRNDDAVEKIDTRDSPISEAKSRTAAFRSGHNNYPTKYNPFEDDPNPDRSLPSVPTASPKHGHYDNLVVNDGPSKNPFEETYPDDKNPFNEDQGVSGSPDASAERDFELIASELCSRSQTEMVNDMPVGGFVQQERSAKLAPDLDELPVLGPAPPESSASPELLDRRTNDVKAGIMQEFCGKDAPVGTEQRGQDCGPESGQKNASNRDQPSNNSDIPTLVRDLNHFLDSTMQTMSSPTAQRRLARGSGDQNPRDSDASSPVRSGSSSRKATSLKDWPCDHCTLVNKSVLSLCQVCGARRPDGAGVDWDAEVKKYFGADGKPKPTQRKESLGIVHGGVAHRAGYYRDTREFLQARSMAGATVDSASQPSQTREVDHADVEAAKVYSEGGSMGRVANAKCKNGELVPGIGVSSGPKLADAVKMPAWGNFQRKHDEKDTGQRSSGDTNGRNALASQPSAGPVNASLDNTRESCSQQIRPLSAEVKKRPILPSTFVSQLLQKESASAPASSPTSAPTSVSPSHDVPDMDEVRRARLAFFAQRARSRSTEDPPTAQSADVATESRGRRSSSESSSLESPTDADDADDESESSDSPQSLPSRSRSSDQRSANFPARCSERSLLPSLKCAEAARSIDGPSASASSPTSPSAPPLPAIKEGSPSEYLEEVVAGSPPQAPVDHEYEDVEVSPRPWKLTPAEKARRRPVSGSLGRAQWMGDALIVPDGRGGKVRCEVERDPSPPQYVIRDGVLYSQLPTLAALESRAEPIPSSRDGSSAMGNTSTEKSRSPPVSSSNSLGSKSTTSKSSSSTPKPADTSSSHTPSTPSSPSCSTSQQKDGTTIADCNGLSPSPKGVAAGAASRGVPDQPLDSDQGHLDLMRDLQRAIDRGQHKQAAVLARKLAALKAEKKRVVGTTILVNLHVEDRTCHVGPMPLQLSPLMSVLELKTQIELDYQLPAPCQRWVIAGEVVPPDDEHRSLAETGVTEGSSVHLYLVPPAAGSTSVSSSAQIVSPKVFLRGASPFESRLGHSHDRERTQYDADTDANDSAEQLAKISGGVSTQRSEICNTRRDTSNTVDESLQRHASARSNAVTDDSNSERAVPSSESVAKLRHIETVGASAEERSSKSRPSSSVSHEV